MKAAIGLRFYKVSAHRKGSHDVEPCPASDLNVAVQAFLAGFVASRVEPKDETEHQRSWYFEELLPDGPSSIRGYVQYGTYGFESRLKNQRTKTPSYNRTVDDVEEVPLFFEFWTPDDGDLTIMSFQSFGGRSCVSLVRQDIKDSFEAANPGFILRFEKLLGTDSPATLYATAPVKKLTLIRQESASDAFTSYNREGPPKTVDFELSVKARRGDNLGRFADLAGGLNKTDKGLVVFRGEEFEEATAMVMIGKRQRPVGIVAPNRDTGTIDVSESINWGANGHPTFESLAEQSTMIAQDLYRRITGG